MTISKIELSSVVDSLSDLLKTFDRASKCLRIPLSKRKIEIGSTKSNDNLFAHYYNNIIEHPTRQTRSSFHFESSNFCISSIKRFELHGNHFVHSENVNINHQKFHHSCKNRHYVANKCELIEINYVV